MIAKDRALVPEEVIRLFAACRRDRDRMICRLLYFAGVQNEQAARLRWHHLNSDDRGHGVLTIAGGRASHRVVIPIHVFAELQRFRRGAEDAALMFGVSSRTVCRIVTRAGRAARIPGSVSPHWLRIAHGSHASDRGAPTALIRDSLGHRSIATTNGYVRARPGDGSSLYLPPI